MNGVPRHSLPWFFLAQLAVVAPHVPRLPWWLLVVWAVCALWRVQVFRGRWSWPGRLAKMLIVFTVLAGILAWYRNPTALESAVGTVVALFFLKLLECHRRRDVYLLSFVALLVAALNLLFAQDVLLSLWVLLSVWLLLVSLMALHDPEPAFGPLRHMRATAALLVQALPLMLVLFLVFPRLAPMWTVPVPGGQSARTGMGDSMTPGDISRLGRSAEPAFRARFAEGVLPPRRELYWRGLALDHFDGRSWRVGYGLLRPPAQSMPSLARPDCEPLDYEVILEPTGGHWLLALGWASSPTEDVLRLASGTLGRRKPVTSRFRYEVTSCPAAAVADLDRVERFSHLSLPPRSNPRSLEFSAALRAEAMDDRMFIAALLQYFREQPFFYTLEPPLLGEHSIDEFLFGTRRGFCEHYAGAMAFLLRAAGIPARVLIGYQGGETNPFEAYVLVQQYDAHAWVEAWLPGEGWLRIDPTAAVAPQRIEAGMPAVMGNEAGFMADSPLASWARGNLWSSRLRLWFDRMDYRWQRWVLGYDGQRQFDFLQRLLGEVSPLRIALLMLAAFALAVVGVLASLWGRDWLQPRDPVLSTYRKFCRLLARQGLERQPGEAPQDYARRVLLQCPQWQQPVQSITDAFVRLSYVPDTAPDRHLQVRALRRQVRRFARQLLLQPMRLTARVPVPPARDSLTGNGER